jgi:hypothetical protein
VPVARLSIAPPPQELLVGDTFHLSAEALDAWNRRLERGVSWSAGDATVLEALGGGRFRAIGAGEASVSAEADGVNAIVRVAVDRIRVASLTVSNALEVLEIGRQFRLGADLRDQRNRALTRPVRWSSSDTRVAVVHPDGLLRAVGSGSVTITAESDGLRASLPLTVPEPAVLFSPPPAAVQAEIQVAAAAAEPEPVVAAPVHAAPPAPPPRGTDDAVGGRRRPGVWIAGGTALTVGVAALWFAFQPDAPPPPVAEPAPPPAVADLLVRAAASGEPVSAGLQLVEGDSIALLATPVAADGAGVPNVAHAWSSTDSRVASVDSAGTVSAVAAGSARIVASAGGVTREVPVTISARVVEDAPARPREAVVATRSPQPGPRGAQPPPTTPAAPPAAPGTLQLLVQPWANVTIDNGRTRPEERRLELQLAPGKHRIRLENPNTLTVDTTFEIVSGAPTLLRIQMPPRIP